MSLFNHWREKVKALAIVAVIAAFSALGGTFGVRYVNDALAQVFGAQEFVNAVTMDSTLGVAGNTTIGGTLNVTGDTSVTGSLNAPGALTVGVSGSPAQFLLYPTTGTAASYVCATANNVIVIQAAAC